MSNDPIWLRKRNNTDHHVLALEFNSTEQIPLKRLSLNWTPESGDLLLAILEILPRNINLPYSSLRPLLEINTQDLVWIANDISLGYRGLKDNRIFAFADLEFTPDVESITSSVNTSVDLWIAEHLAPFCQRHGVSDIFEKLRDLAALKSLVWTRETTDVLPVAETGNNGFFSLAPQYLARLLEGVELFDEMGPCRRVTGPSFGGNAFELVTFPKLIDSRSGPVAFSVSARMSIESQPYSPNLILKVGASRTRWLHRDVRVPPGMFRLGGLIFPKGVDHKAIRFEINPGDGTDRGSWQINKPLFEQMRVRSGIPHIDGLEDLVSLPPDESQGWAGVNFHTRFGSHPVGSGISERDEAELFERVRSALEGIVGDPVTGTSVAIPRGVRPKREAPMLRLVEYLAAHADEEGDTDNLTAFQRVMVKAFPDISSGDLDKISEISPKQVRSRDLDLFRAMNAEIISNIHGEDKPALWLLARSKEERDRMEWAATAIFADAVNLHVAELPLGTHGPLRTLHKRGTPADERFKTQVGKWKPTAEAIAAFPNSYVLVQAPMHFDNPNGKIPLEDDKVNKSVGIHSLAKYANANVHYLLPPEGVDGSRPILAYLQRFQAAVFDLLFGHNAYTVGIPEIIEEAFSHESAPKHVIGLGLIRQNSGRFDPGRHSVIGYAIRTDVETSASDICLSYRGRTSSLVITPWMTFAEGLRSAAAETHMSLGRRRDEVFAGFREMADKVISESCAADARPLILIDTSNSRGAWEWLNNDKLDPGNIHLDSLKMHMEIDWTGARIVRVDTKSALHIKNSVDYSLTQYNADGTESGNTGEYRSWTTSKSILSVSGCENGGRHYLAVFGYPATVQVARDQCGYREIEVLKRLAPKDKLPGIDGDQRRYRMDSAIPDQLTTPNSLALTVALSAPGDDPDKIAWAVNELRRDHAHTSATTTLPAPLFYENKLRTDYMILQKIEEIKTDKYEAEK